MTWLCQQYEIVSNAILNAQKGILKPHTITPFEIFQHFKASASDLHAGLSLPIASSINNGYLLLKIMKLDVFINKGALAYVIRLPLTDSVKYSAYKVSIKIKKYDE